MGELVWTNSSSLAVEWFVITPLGSVADTLKPGEEYRHQNGLDIKQVGMRCLSGSAYVINSLDRQAGADSHLIASDVIPMTQQDVTVLASVRYFRIGPIEIGPNSVEQVERMIERNEVCVVGVDGPKDENLRGPFFIEVGPIVYLPNEDLTKLMMRFSLKNPINETALVYANIVAIRK